ncbi:4'-phosphopantetheinyl transferase EntD [Krasilnikovia cinnamomea]|uniref:4'-phosphopantetheinyl transferase EntD n=1 Tax=Krasilnikovia cinnamomea TaxID=349313 RepID=A0A4Q7ZCF7_9ACTN|nr:4'-phosphopantetheinyl transferase superfamily protein [Krasilnikovia cinnamomea]RZU48337.1 4'-phosphopantetheinyl transferase EntD [Krasilnikovia cinnamomea]
MPPPTFARLLPETVVAVESYGDAGTEPVFPGEEDLVADAVAGRRREFVTARRCAREALARLGHAPAPIRRGPKGSPVWPPGVAGSITHCTGFRAAAVVGIGELVSVGIDAERAGPLPDGVQPLITVPGEERMLDRLAADHPAGPWGKVLFSAKESVYKAWFPLTGRWLGFEDARLSIDPVAGTFRADLLVSGTRRDGGAPLTELRGRFLVDEGLILTAVTVEAD